MGTPLRGYEKIILLLVCIAFITLASYSCQKPQTDQTNANVVAVGGRQHSLEEATAIIEAFLAEPFSEDERHVRRIGKIAHYEQTGEVLR